MASTDGFSVLFVLWESYSRNESMLQLWCKKEFEVGEVIDKHVAGTRWGFDSLTIKNESIVKMVEVRIM